MSTELQLSKKQLREAAYRLIEAILENRMADVEAIAADLVVLSTHIVQIEQRMGR